LLFNAPQRTYIDTVAAGVTEAFIDIAGFLLIHEDRSGGASGTADTAAGTLIFQYMIGHESAAPSFEIFFLEVLGIHKIEKLVKL
jgi:hypothetical protein